MLDKTIERIGQDITLYSYSYEHNSYDDAQVSTGAFTTIKGIVKTPEENREVRHDGRRLHVELEVIVKSDVDINVISDDSPPSILRFKYDGTTRTYKAISRRTSKHPFKDYKTKIIGLKVAAKGPDISPSLG